MKLKDVINEFLKNLSKISKFYFCEDFSVILNGMLIYTKITDRLNNKFKIS